MMDDAKSPETGPLPPYLAARYASWHATSFEENKAWFARLADKGQSPRTMMIQCCDSRVNVVQMFGAEPGDLFVVRNVANLVPPYRPDHQHHGTSAAVEYAVKVLKVAHIVIVGHSGCGGVHACHDMCSGNAPELEEVSSFIGRWMDILRPGYDAVVARVDGEAAQKTELEREGVLVSLRNLETFPFVAAAQASGALTLHGAWLDIASGVLHVHDPKRGFSSD